MGKRHNLHQMLEWTKGQASLMDCCGRSIISWRAGLHMQACDIELMVQEALSQRCGYQLPKKGQLQFLPTMDLNTSKSGDQWKIIHFHASFLERE